MACHRNIIAKNQIARIEQCSCGQIHLHIGPMTLRFESEPFQDLTQVLQRATQIVSQEKVTHSGLGVRD